MACEPRYLAAGREPAQTSLTLIPWRFYISRGWIASGFHILGFVRLPAQLRQLDYFAAGGRGGYQFVVFICDADTTESSSDAIMQARSRSPPTQQNLGATQGNISTAAPPAKDFEGLTTPKRLRSLSKLSAPATGNPSPEATD
jgi:hypothetical protein